MEIIKISEKVEVHVQESKYRKDCLDIRKFITTKRYTGYTKQGITIPKDKLNELLSAIKIVVGEM